MQLRWARIASWSDAPDQLILQYRDDNQKCWVDVAEESISHPHWRHLNDEDYDKKCNEYVYNRTKRK